MKSKLSSDYLSFMLYKGAHHLYKNSKSPQVKAKIAHLLHDLTEDIESLHFVGLPKDQFLFDDEQAFEEFLAYENIVPENASDEDWRQIVDRSIPEQVDERFIHDLCAVVSNIRSQLQVLDVTLIPVFDRLVSAGRSKIDQIISSSPEEVGVVYHQGYEKGLDLNAEDIKELKSDINKTYESILGLYNSQPALLRAAQEPFNQLVCYFNGEYYETATYDDLKKLIIKVFEQIKANDERIAQTQSQYELIDAKMNQIRGKSLMLTEPFSISNRILGAGPDDANSQLEFIDSSYGRLIQDYHNVGEVNVTYQIKQINKHLKAAAATIAAHLRLAKINYTNVDNLN